MATKHVVVMTDDLDGTEADQTVKFSYAGSDYEIDLSKTNLAKLDKALEKYVSAARRIPKTRRRRQAQS